MSPLGENPIPEAEPTPIDYSVFDSATLREIQRSEAMGYTLVRSGTPGDEAFIRVLQEIDQQKSPYILARGETLLEAGHTSAIYLIFIQK
ncbi:hypothetical protein ACFL2V_09370 [Pseudomonadota bacterium]